MSHTLLCVLLCSLVLGQAQAQSGVPTPAQTPWPVTESVARGTAGDLDGDGHVDPVLLVGDHLEVAYGLGHYTARLITDVQANDVTLVPASGPHPDRLLIVDGSGAALVDYTPTATDSFTTTPLSLTGWAGARRVLLTGEGERCLVGVDAAGTTLLLANSPFGPTPLQQSLPLGAEILDLICLDLIGDSSEEVLIVTTDTVLTYDRDAQAFAVLFAMPALDRAVLTRLRQIGAARDRAAAVMRYASTSADILFVMDENGAEVPLNLGNADTYGVAALDLDGDQDDDLVLTHRAPLGAFQPLVLRNQSNGLPPSPSQPSFALAGGVNELLDFGLSGDPGPTQRAWPVATDLSGDGDLDLLLFHQASGTLLSMENTSIDHTELTLVPAHLGSEGVVHFVEESGQAWVSLPLLVPGPTSDHPALAIDAVHVLQRTATLVGGELMLQHDSGYADTLPFTPGVPFELDLWAFDPAEPYRYVELRAIQTDPLSGAPLFVGPTNAFVVYLDLTEDHALVGASLDLALDDGVIELGTDLDYGLIESENGGPHGGGGLGPIGDPPGYEGDENEGDPAPQPPPPPPPGS